MVPLYAARVSDLGPRDFVHLECNDCRHDLMIAASTLTNGLRLGPDLRPTWNGVSAAEKAMLMGRAVVSIRWADTTHCKPLIGSHI